MAAVRTLKIIGQNLSENRSKTISFPGSSCKTALTCFGSETVNIRHAE